MKNKVSILIITMILFVISGCSSPKPETTVSEFIEGMKNFDLELMESKVNPENPTENDNILNLEDEEDQFQVYLLDYLKSNAKEIEYNLKDTQINDDKATVSVDFKYIDGGQLFRAAFAEYIKDAFSLAFSGMEMTDEENSQMFITIMEEQREVIDETFVERTLDIELIKKDDQWFIDKPSDELLDVAMSNIISVFNEMENSFEVDSENNIDAPGTIMDQAEADNMNIVERNIGDEVTLETIIFKVTNVEETQTLTPTYGDPVSAKDGAKFVLVSLDITNITKSEFTMSPDLILVDNEDREFSSYSDSIWAIDDYLDYRDLSPSIKETGRFVYELPNDATNYYLIVGKGGTNDLYKVILK